MDTLEAGHAGATAALLPDTYPTSLFDGGAAVNADHFRWLPDASVDLLLTDPPYRIARDTNFHTYAGNTVNSFRFDDGKGWDSYTHDDFVALLGDWAAEFARVLRPGGTFAVFCADAYLSHLRDALGAAGLKVRRTLTWTKPNAVPVNRKTMMMSACEYVVVGVKGSAATFNATVPTGDVAGLRDIESVLVSGKAADVVAAAVRRALADVDACGPDRPDAVAAAVRAAVESAAADAEGKARAMFSDADTFRGCVPNHVSFPSKTGHRIHPTEKNPDLLTYLVRLLSAEGDVVCDPFAGSGSTGAACRTAGRTAILVERDPGFFAALTDRLAG